MSTLFDLSALASLRYVATISSALILCHLLALAIYRLFLHPLSRFPGPKLAALTSWYEYHYDVHKRGKFTFEIQRLHSIYGPIIRIGPNEVHISDPEFYDTLYATGVRKRNLDPVSAGAFGIPGSMLSTVDHDHHKLRRGALSSFFSKASVTKLEPLIKRKVEELCVRFRAFEGTGTPVRVDHAFTALTTDLITEYSFGASYGIMDHDGFGREWAGMFRATSEASLFTKQFPRLSMAVRRLPVWVQCRVNPDFGEIGEFVMSTRAQIERVLSRRQEGVDKSDHVTIFHEILDSSLPESEKTPGRLEEEAQTMVAAGALTTAHFLKAAIFHILDNPDVLRALRQELEEFGQNNSWEDPWTQLPPEREFEQLPYLNMVVHEVFRLTYGVTARLPRVAPNEEIQYKQWSIPRGTAVSMTSYIQHRNEKLFPDPGRFDPERFRATVQGDERLDRYLVNFSRGPRSCLGMNLAKHEIFLAVPALVRRFMSPVEEGKEGANGRALRMRLFETDKSDVEIVHDFFNPYPKLDSQGVRVLIS